MAKDKGKTPPAPEPEPKEPVREPVGAPDPTPEPEPEPSNIPERFQGKELGDVIKMYEDAEKEKDRSGTEVGNLRKEVDDMKNTASYYQNLAQNLQTQQGQGGGQVEGEVKPDIQFNYDNPLPSVEQVFDRKFKEYEEKRGKADRDREDQRASMNFATGRGKAMQNNPELFRGVEREVENGMWQYYKAGRITADELRDPESWENGARILHLSKKDWGRIPPPKVTPVSSVPTEKPGAAKPVLPEEKPIQFDSDQREMIRGLGGKDITDKEVAEMVKKERELKRKTEE